MQPTFFPTPDDFRRWLAQHHDSARELWVGFYKKGSGRPSITWPESIDEALCFGWIDGVRRSLDEESYVIRFTPRRQGGRWSAINTRRAEELIRGGRMQPAGLRAFEARDPEKPSGGLRGRNPPELTPEHEARFRANPEAWSHFEAQPPGYRRLVIGWVIGAKQEATRIRRLETLIQHSASGKRVRFM
ncbi:MAG TPA: YdeI/OmpD-associated family protein [Longimicrobiaceae bacterium]